MSDTAAPTTSRPATDLDGKLLLAPEEARALLRECFAQFRSGLSEVVAASIDGTNDLFEENKFVSDAEVADFRSQRPEWLKRFEQALQDLFERRLSGARRSGRRPDADRSLASLRVLNAFDQEKQAVLVVATQFVHRLTKREVDALDLRVGVLLGEVHAREIDNPFAPDYILDAIGMTSRALLPNPRAWRPLMERVLVDITPAVTKIYIRLNRLLADRYVLPEIKAELRARSDLRPADDGELLPLFGRLIKEVAPPELALDVAVPAASERDGVPPSIAAGAAASAPARGTAAAPTAGVLTAVAAPPAGSANPYAAELARTPPEPVAAPRATDAFGLPQLDPLLALGPLSAIVAALDRWQLSDPGAAAGLSARPAETAAQAEPGSAMQAPRNRIPWIRAAVADKVGNPTDKITIDVIALLFDYIFRDPSIPESLRDLFAKLQVPTLKAALLDRTFFSDKKHPARRLLDHLAAAAIGATGDEAYRVGIELVAAGVIEEVCRDFKVDLAVFEAADAKLQDFVDAEQRKAAALLNEDVAAALVAEESESDRTHARTLIRDRLTGIDVPFEVRGFAETIWADYLALVRKRDGEESEPWRDGVRTLDDLLWSITAKERNAQKARLARMVPGLIRSLRQGGAEVSVKDERLRPFLEAIYRMHMAAIRPHTERQKSTATAPPADAASSESGPAGDQRPPEAPAASGEADAAARIANVHDFVGEMVVGTWLAFEREGKAVNARLSWVSPMRSKYIFTTRSRGQAIAVSPEELAWQLRDGTARLVVEPVPLFDRAVSSALDELAAIKPGAAAAD